jgi:C4-dicarboxylate-specific signal transduction histidine kinase
MWDLFPKEYADKQMDVVRKVITTQQGCITESQTMVNGKIAWFNTSVQPVRYHSQEIVLALVIAKDVTERKEAEVALAQSYQKLRETQEQLIQSSKMNAMNQLAAGISHELNQPLTGIKGFAQVVLLDMEENNPFRKDIEKIVAQSERMEAIINNVRSFARKSGFKLEELRINKPIEDSLVLLKEQLRVHNIRVEKDLMADLPLIRGDANQLQQVFINLITNARDAIDSAHTPDGGQITIKTWFDAEKHAVNVSFQDSGCGIKKENMESIFNPFFTTKSPNGGLGLGLSIVYRIVENHKATISVDSVEHKGTTFFISFPLPAA